MSSNVYSQFRHADRLKTIKLRSQVLPTTCSKHVHRTNNFETTQQLVGVLYSAPFLRFPSFQLYRGLVFLSSKASPPPSFPTFSSRDRMSSSISLETHCVCTLFKWIFLCFVGLVRSCLEFHRTKRRFIIVSLLIDSRLHFLVDFRLIRLLEDFKRFEWVLWEEYGDNM